MLDRDLANLKRGAELFLGLIDDVGTPRVKRVHLTSETPFVTSAKGSPLYVVSDGSAYLASWLHQTEAEAVRWVYQMLDTRVRAYMILRDEWHDRHQAMFETPGRTHPTTTEPT